MDSRLAPPEFRMGSSHAKSAYRRLTESFVSDLWNRHWLRHLVYATAVRLLPISRLVSADSVRIALLGNCEATHCPNGPPLGSGS